MNNAERRQGIIELAASIEQEAPPPEGRRAPRLHFLKCGRDDPLEQSFAQLDKVPWFAGIYIEIRYGHPHYFTRLRQACDMARSRGKVVYHQVQTMEYDGNRDADDLAPLGETIFQRTPASYALAKHLPGVAERFCQHIDTIRHGFDDDPAFGYIDTAETAPGTIAQKIAGFMVEQERAYRLELEALARFKHAQPMACINFFGGRVDELVAYAHELGIGLAPADAILSDGMKARQPGQIYCAHLTEYAISSKKPGVTHGSIKAAYEWAIRQPAPVNVITWQSWHDWMTAIDLTKANPL